MGLLTKKLQQLMQGSANALLLLAGLCHGVGIRLPGWGQGRREVAPGGAQAIHQLVRSSFRDSGKQEAAGRVGWGMRMPLCR